MSAPAGKIFDPFASPDIQDLEPTHVLDWERIARKIVRDVLVLGRHERVIISADPYFGGAALDALRIEIQKAQAIEFATLMHWTPGITALRQRNGCARDPLDEAAELRAMKELFNCADVFILLMNDRRSGRRTVVGGQIEAVIEQWNGRAVHLHWFHDPSIPDPAHPVNLALDRMNQAATIDLDYPALKRTMLALTALARSRELRLTDPRGTDLRFRISGDFHRNCGDASRAHMANARSGRDREEELPAGSFRAIPDAGSANGVIVCPDTPGGESPALARGMNFSAFIPKGLRFLFRDGRVSSIETGGDQAAFDRLWADETGDKDRLGELVLGCNPLLSPIPGSDFQPHYGFGAGVVRLILGDNTLSGGTFKSSFHRWVMLTDATLTADAQPLVVRGRLVDH